MKTFELTPEQERHWQVMNDNVIRYEESSSSYEADPALKLARIRGEPSKRMKYLRREGSECEKFFSLGGSARNVAQSGGETAAESVTQFTGEFEKVCLDDPELLRMLSDLHAMIAESRLVTADQSGSFERLIQEANSFFEGKIGGRVSYNTKADDVMRKFAVVQTNFLKFFVELGSRIDLYQDILSRHPLFSDIGHVKLQVDAVHDLLLNSMLNTSESGGLSVAIPEKYTADFDASLKCIDTKVHNAFLAKAVYLHKIGLVPHIKYFLTLANIIAYVERVAWKDSEIQGVFPDLCDPEDDSLVLDVENFSHPAIYNGKPLRKYFSDLYNTLGDQIFDLLHEDGLIEGNQHWKQGVTMADVENFIRKHKIEPGPAENIAQLYTKAAFVPFHGIHLNARKRIQIVTGANFNGKSTYMQSIGYLFHQAATARKLIATRARLSLPDMVFDDFDVNSQRQRDISKDRSTFSSQVHKVIQFMDRGTRRSIGLFDELYHGTSAPYLLSLGWATIEKFEELGLYAIISTHEPLLTRFPEEGGYESLEGKYARPSHTASGTRSTAVANVSMQGVYQLTDGPVIDSDAFRIARQEGMREDVLIRAQEIFAHITKANKATET